MKRFSKCYALPAVFLFVAWSGHPVFSQCAKPAPTLNDECPPTRQEYEGCKTVGKDQQDAERFVGDQVRAGKPARLAERFPNEERKRVLRGCFIQGLLSNKLSVPQSRVVIQDATIEGPVDLRDREIPYHVELIHCMFRDEVNLKRSHFVKGLSFECSSFDSRFDADSAIVDFDFTIADCKFFNCRTLLNSMSIGVNLLAARAQFAGDVNFTGTRIQGTLDAQRTVYHGNADFEALRVGIDAGWTGAIFDGWVSFDNAEFKNLSIAQCLFLGDVRFVSTKIDNFYLSVGNSTAQVDKMFTRALKIEDMTFQYMSPEDWSQLKGFAEVSNKGPAEPNYKAYNAQFYSSLEAQFRRHGRPDDADEVYIAGKRKERESFWWPWRAWSYFQDCFIGYGRHLEKLLFYWSPVILVLFGFLPFGWKSRMETKKREDARRYWKKYCGILYALDLFIPIVGLGYADIWTPKTPWRLYFFKPLLVISGHLLVPIGLAAWTGIIK